MLPRSEYRPRHSRSYKRDSNPVILRWIAGFFHSTGFCIFHSAPYSARASASGKNFRRKFLNPLQMYPRKCQRLIRRTIFGDKCHFVLSEKLQTVHTHLYMQTSSQPFIWTLKQGCNNGALGTFPVFRAAKWSVPRWTGGFRR